MQAEPDPLRNKTAIESWISDRLLEDDVLAGHVPGFALADPEGLRGKELTAVLDNRRFVDIEPIRFDDLNHMLACNTDEAAFVAEHAAAVLRDAIVDEDLHVPTFTAGSLMLNAPPIAMIVSDILRIDRHRRRFRVPVAFTRGLNPGAVLLVKSGQPGSYLVGSGGAENRGPTVRVHIPAQTYRVGSQRPRVIRVTVTDPTSIFDPHSGALPF